tara:strand:+ start:9233 stop:10762 length:1530 start_codon:yes stop_codon:yes gene_type:complete
MYRILTASKDAYITNKIINNKFRVKDANTGRAGTLDLFKLYAETTSGSDSTPIELSRVLLKFDLSPLRSLTSSILDFSRSDFKCLIKMRDVYGGQTTPSNFKLQIFPLSKSFDEGVGRDIVRFEDLDTCNFLTASVTGDSPTLWSHEGASSKGLMGSNDIDVIASGNLMDGNGVVDLWKEQEFSSGEEDLNIDITTVVSGILSNQISDHGFRVSFSGSQEEDQVTRFVKRFGSRHSTNTYLRPALVAYWDDTIKDHGSEFIFDLTGSLFLNNSARGALINIVSGTQAAPITGSDCIMLRLTSGSGTGSFSKIVTGSQHNIGNSYMTGVYSATFAISSFNTLLNEEIKNAASATFDQYWQSRDGSVGFLTSSLVIKLPDRTSYSRSTNRLFVNITNLRTEYSRSQKVRFRVFVEDVGKQIVATKTPLASVSEIFNNMFYRVKDAENNRVIIPFETESNGTCLSTDSKGMFFDLYISDLYAGRTYAFDFLVKDRGIDDLFVDVASTFRVSN